MKRIGLADKKGAVSKEAASFFFSIGSFMEAGMGNVASVRFVSKLEGKEVSVALLCCRNLFFEVVDR